MQAPARSPSDYLASLNPAQRTAATHGLRAGGPFRSGPLLVIAGAGTGKTMTLAHRVAHLNRWSPRADLEQLEQIAGRYPTRERFLTELTLDPPAAAGGRAGDPRLDEDYLILSTVHSAKGQEWNAVFVLSVSDGHFPSEFATAKPELVEEERRLLYVAMTRAKESLYLLAPLRYYVTQQARDGDRHVYGARSRFLTDAVLDTMERRFPGRADRADLLAPRSTKRIDVAARLRELW